MLESINATSAAVDAFICTKVAQEVDLILLELLMLGCSLRTIRWNHFGSDLLRIALGPWHAISVGTFKIILTLANKVTDLGHIRR